LKSGLEEGKIPHSGCRLLYFLCYPLENNAEMTSLPHKLRIFDQNWHLPALSQRDWPRVCCTRCSDPGDGFI